MAGVASPMREEDRRRFARFAAGLTIGHLVAAMLLALLLGFGGELIARLLPHTGRVVLAGVLGLGFGIADLLDRTPHVWRQVPKRFIGMLSPGTLGTVWGFDLGLLVTTQKTTSLLWASIPAVALLAPARLPVVLAGFSLVWLLATVLGSLRPWATQIGGRLGRHWQPPLRRITGAALVVTGLVAVAGTLFR